MMSSTMTGEKCENETKVTWCVVWFTESKEYSVIPTNWIVKNNESQSDSLFCKWPPYKVTSDHLKKAITPSQSWKTYRVKFVGVNKTYDNFNKAWHKKVKEQYSSTDTNDSSKNKNKRFLMCPSDDTDDDDNDDDNGINFNILPCKQVVSTPSVALEPINYGASTSSIISQFYAENNVNVEETMQYTEMQPKRVEQLEYPQNHSFAEDTSCFNPVSHDSPLNFNGNDRCSSQVDEKLNKIISEQIGIKLLLNRILSKIETNSLSNSQKSINLNESFVCKFPMNDTEDFISVQNCILNEFDFKSKLEYFIKTIGGNTPKNHVTRVMSKLFSDKYGIECTWTGRGKNISTKIGDSDLIKIMKKSIQESCTNTTITDAEFERVVSEWLRHANTRCSRQKI
ncbi:uncharacterized protein LOC114131173 [Aphis gossypii]|uniref:uncharacterized protein LOC114131173 n=1 Tax=Aphis gossypii TaxID=80765 RepID=UPI0021596926|nr:uncharacterized protein LOC114131173 [Aphis gossypii]